MAVTKPSHAVSAFASFVRERLADVASTFSPLWSAKDQVEILPARGRPDGEVGAARHLAMVIMGAAAPFAPTSHARARLLRQAYASGLLTDEEVGRAFAVLAIDAAPPASRQREVDVLGASG